METRKIPLESIYSTTGQKSLKPVKGHHSEPYSNDLSQIRSGLRSGASNIFLVRGNNITQAIAATRRLFVGGGAADVPVLEGVGLEEGPLWLVTYFGSAGSKPSAWQVEPVEQKGKTIRVPFWKPGRLGSTSDIHAYLVWIPLGELEEGAYTLELFDINQREVILMRRVLVEAKREKKIPSP
jgi:hypothetical protein